MYDYHNRFERPFRNLHVYNLSYGGENAGRLIVRWSRTGVGCRVWLQFWGRSMVEGYASSDSHIYSVETRVVIALVQKIHAEAVQEMAADLGNLWPGFPISRGELLRLAEGYERVTGPIFNGFPDALPTLLDLIDCPPGERWYNHFKAVGFTVQHLL